MTTTPARENPPQANDCEHYFASHIRGGEPLHVRLCQLCHEPDWSDLAEQAAEVRAAALEEAADYLRDAHFRDGMSVQEIGVALRGTAAAARPDNTTGA